MAKNRQVLFRCEPKGLPSVDDFEIVEKLVPEIGENQFLIRNLYLSLDPYMRMLKTARRASRAHHGWTNGPYWG